MTSFNVDYGPLASTDDQARALSAHNAAVWADELQKRCGFLRGRRVLDIGCGAGRFTALLAGPLRCQAVGMDRSTAMLERAREKPLPDIQWLLGDAEHLPFGPSTFDGCLFSLVLHHVSDVQRALEEAHRVLGRRGVCAIMTVSHRQLRASLDARFFPSALAIDLERVPDIDQLRAHLANAGFRRVEHFGVVQEFVRSGAEYLEKLRGRYSSTLTLIPEAEYASGLAEAERHFSIHGLLEGRQREELTLVVGMK